MTQIILTTAQQSQLQMRLNNKDILGFYQTLESYGDAYGRLGKGITSSITWQGQIANGFAQYYVAPQGQDMGYGSPKWRAVNQQLAESYLNQIKNDSGVLPNYQDIKDIHNNVYKNNNLPKDAWFPNKMLEQSANPDALWQDWMKNDSPRDIIEDGIDIAKALPNGDFSKAFGGALWNMDANGVADFTRAMGGFPALGELFGGALGGIIGGSVAPVGIWGGAVLGANLGRILGTLPDWIKSVLSKFGEAEAPVSPLILDLDGDGIEVSALNGAGSVYWDIDNDGFREASAWVGKDDGLLALDRNANGVIDNHSELFGTDKIDGFTVLTAMDSNKDNRIDSRDTDFAKLRIWQDANSDGISQASELKTLAQAGIKSISLNDTTTNQTINGNKVTHISTFTKTNNTTGTIADVWLFIPVNDNFNPKHILLAA
jgi:hypothetical protein